MDFLLLLEIVLFGIVEGITEWLPISSTGHMILLEELLPIKEQLGSNGEAFWEFFLVFIQFGAILAVIFNFFHELWPFGKKKAKEQKNSIWKIWLYIIIACLPAAIIGVFLDDLLNKYLYNFLTVSLTLLIYGIFFVVFELLYKRKGFSTRFPTVENFNWKVALIIGITQTLALIPGTSRSGVTILIALLLGCSREASAKFSFYVSIPIMIGATLLKGFNFFYEGNVMSGAEWGYLFIGAFIAFFVSLLVIRFFMKFLKNHSFLGFGIYRIVFGIVLLILFFSLPSFHSLSPEASNLSSSFQLNLSYLRVVFTNFKNFALPS